MRVRVDEPRQHGQVGQVDDLGTGGNGDAGTNLPDPFAFDDDDLVGGDGPDSGSIRRPALTAMTFCGPAGWRLGVNTHGYERDEASAVGIASTTLCRASE